MRNIVLLLTLWTFVVHSGEVVFIATSDLHGDLETFSRLAVEIRKYPQAVKVDLGDMMQGNYPVFVQNGVPVIEAFNELGYDFIVPGNHDVEFPEKSLLQWQQIFKGQFLGGQWQLGEFKMPGYAVIERNGFRIGIIALGETGIGKRLDYWDKLHYSNEADVVRDSLEKLSASQCHAYILLCHISSDNIFLRQMVYENPEINAVIAAHSHREKPGTRIGRAFICQPGAYAGSAVKLRMIFDDHSSKLNYITGELLRPAEESDPEILHIWQKSLALSRAAGGVKLREFRNKNEFIRASCDALKEAFDTDAALISMPKNAMIPMDAESLFRIFPFSNRLAVVEVSAAELEKIVKNSGRGKTKIYGSGDFSGEKIKVVMSDYLLMTLSRKMKISGQIVEKFEYNVLLEALKCKEYSEFNAEKFEKSPSRTKL